MKIRLTDPKLRALRPRDKPYDTMDSQVHGYGARTLVTGQVVHVMYCRFPGSKNPTRRKLGRYGNPSLPMGKPEMTLAQARDLAVEWLAKIRKGIDPSREAEQAAQAAIEAERLRKANTLSAVLDAYIAHKADLRSIRATEVVMRRELASWLNWPLQNITERDVRELIGRIKAGRKGQARLTLRLVKAFFTWCVDNNYLSVSPCARIKTTAFVGTTPEIKRELDDHEIRALWRASDKLGYPAGPWFRLLLLTGLRRNEAAEASWSEFDFTTKRWIIPEARMKGAKPHLIPVADEIQALLDSLPRFTAGDFLFTTGDGSKPISSFSKAKAALDKLMTEELALEGRDFVPWTIHDIRRSCRTRFSSIGIPENIGERLLAHAQPELTRRYNLYGFEREKLAALQTWHRALTNIIEPIDNVVPLRAS